MQEIIIYTDGACSYNPGPGGWAAIIQTPNSKKSITGYDPNTTNNRMELMAAIMSLKYVQENNLEFYTIKIFTDSKYVQNGITTWIHNWIKNNWIGSNKEVVKNIDLWQTLNKLNMKYDISWNWVKGHNTDKMNIEVDKLAKLAITTQGRLS